MELDPVTVIVSIVVLMLFALPFVLDSRSRARKGEQLLQTLQRHAQQQGRSVEHHESCGRTAMASAADGKALYFLDLQAANNAVLQVELAEVRACEAVKNFSNTKGQQRDAVLERVELCLWPKDKSKAEMRLELYRNGQSPMLNGEVQYADKWAGLINSQLKSR